VNSIAAVPLIARDMTQTHAPTLRETINGGSTPASMRVMVIAVCARSISLAINGAVLE